MCEVTAGDHTLLHMLLFLAPDTITNAGTCTSRACIRGDKSRSLVHVLQHVWLPTFKVGPNIWHIFS